MANVADLNLIQINNFPEVESPEDWIVVSDAAGLGYKISKENFKAFLGTVQVLAPKAIAPTDPAPTLSGVYYPTITQNEAGTPIVYGNAGGIEVNTDEGGSDYGNQVQLIFDGASWVKVGTPINVQPATGEIEPGDSRAVSGNEVYTSVKVGLDTITNLLNVFNTDDIELFALDATNKITSNANGRMLIVPCKEGDEFSFKRNSITQTNRLIIGYSSVLPAPTVVLNNVVNHGANLEFTTTAPAGAKYFIVYVSLDTVEPNYDGYFLYKNEAPVNISGLVASGDNRGVTGDEVYKSVKVGLNAVTDLLNIFNTQDIELFGLSTDNKISTNVNGRLLVVPTVEGDEFTFSRKSTTQNNRLTIGYTSTVPANGVQVNNVVNHATQLEFKSTAPAGAKYFIIYLSLATTEPDYSGIFLGKKGVATDSGTTDSGLRTDIGIYDPQFSENIFSNAILVNAYVSQSNRVTESANYRSILLNNLKRGERFLIDLTGSGSNKSVIATSITTDEVNENKLMDGSYTPTTTPFVFEVTGFTKQAYIYISDNGATLDTSKIVVKKLHPKNIEIIDRRTINGILKYYEAQISEDVSPASTTLNLRAANINDIYARFDALMTANPGVITKRLLEYGSSETNPEAPVNAPDPALPIYEYTFSWLKENMDANPLNAQGLRLQKRPKFLIACGLHGDEKSTTWATYLMFKDMIDEMVKENLLYEFKSQLEFVVVPIANPWGFNFDQRMMANGADLNRSFPLSVKGDAMYNKYPEIRAVLNSLDANRDSYAFIDYHCLEKSTRPYSGYINTENELSREAFSQLAYEMNKRIIDIYELPDSDILQFFYSTTKGDLLEKYVMLTTPIRYTAVIECLEDFGGVYYSQKVIQAAEEILVNYIRSIFLR